MKAKVYLRVRRRPSNYKMINGIEDQGRLHEPEELRPLTKSQIYNRLNNEFYLPAKESRAVSRAYLVAVFRNQVYRVDRAQILQFEAGLQLDEQVKYTVQNITVLIERTNALLVQLGRPHLGYTPGNYPEEPYMLRLIRFIDQTNLLGVFKRGVRGAAVPQILASRV